MPIYIYKHPKKDKFVEVIQSMNDEHTYFDDKKTQWERVWTVPQGNIALKIDATSSKDFAYQTATMKGSVGDLHDISQELSEKRSQRTDDGRDPLKDKHLDNWSAKRHGKRHTEDDR